MSDVGVAPAPASAPSTSSAGEVAVPQNQVHVPNPVGPQAPNKPVDESSFKGSEHRPLSRRETIQKAFDRADTAERREATKPRQAKIGDNHPPEETPRDRPRKGEPPRETIDLKKRPDNQPPPRERAEHGHFAPSRDRGQDASQAQPEARQSVSALPAHAPYRDAPPRMHERARAEWHATPESVRGEVTRMHHDFSRAHQAYKADHDYMNALRPYANLAHSSGTNLAKALESYTGMEHLLRNDLVAGLDMIISNLNLVNQQTGQRITLPDIAWHVLNTTPEQQKLIQSRNTQMAQSHQMQQQQQRIDRLEKQNAQMQYAAHFHQTRSAVDCYADTHPRLDELGDVILNEVNLGFDLDTAYRRAELLRPATHAAQTRTERPHAAQTRNPPAQTRTPDRSIHGGPGSLNGSSRKGPVSRRDALTNAIRQVRG
jgi:hypothetical protein